MSIAKISEEIRNMNQFTEMKDKQMKRIPNAKRNTKVLVKMKFITPKFKVALDTLII
jgi:hypothetical protein